MLINTQLHNDDDYDVYTTKGSPTSFHRASILARDHMPPSNRIPRGSRFPLDNPHAVLRSAPATYRANGMVVLLNLARPEPGLEAGCSPLAGDAFVEWPTERRRAPCSGNVRSAERPIHQTFS